MLYRTPQRELLFAVALCFFSSLFTFAQPNNSGKQVDAKLSSAITNPATPPKNIPTGQPERFKGFAPVVIYYRSQDGTRNRGPKSQPATPAAEQRLVKSIDSVPRGTDRPTVTKSTENFHSAPVATESSAPATSIAAAQPETKSELRDPAGPIADQPTPQEQKENRAASDSQAKPTPVSVLPAQPAAVPAPAAISNEPEVKGAASVQPRQHAAPVDEKNESVEVENSQGGSTVPERSFSPGGESAASVKGPAAPAVVTSDDPVGLNNAAVRFLAEARYEEAAQALQRAIAAAPDQSKFHRNLSVVYERMNRMNEAVAEAQRSVDLAPREPIALVQLCALNVMVLRNAQALTCFEKLIALGALDSDSQTFYGVALLRTGDNRKAVSILEQAARHSPTDIGTLNALGLAYFNLRRYSDSAQCFKQAVEIEPKRGELRFNLAVAQAANRNKEAGLSQYRILREDNPKLAAELYQLLFQDKVVQVAALKKR